MSAQVHNRSLSQTEKRVVHPSFPLLSFALLGSLSFVFQDPRYLLVIYLFDLALITWLGWPRLLGRMYLLVGGIGGLFTTVSWFPFVSQGEAYWRGVIPLINYPIQITDVGVMWGMGMGLRILSIVLLSMYYLFTTSPRQIAMGLRGIGVPFSIGFLLSMIFRFIPLVKNDLQTIREAQMARGMQMNSGSLVSRMKKYGYLLIPLIFTSLKRVQLIANALDAKAFSMRSRQHRYYRMPRWRGQEIATLVILCLVVAALLYLARIHPVQYGILLPARI